MDGISVDFSLEDVYIGDAPEETCTKTRTTVDASYDELEITCTYDNDKSRYSAAQV